MSRNTGSNETGRFDARDGPHMFAEFNDFSDFYPTDYIISYQSGADDFDEFYEFSSNPQKQNSALRN